MSHKRALIAGIAAVVLGSSSPPAFAASLAPETVANPVVVSQSGGSVGQMNFDTTFSDATATGTARATGLRLKSGRTYRIQTCVWAKAIEQAPESSCQSKQVKVDFLGSLLGGSSAPTAQLQFPRPAAGKPSATIAGTVIVDEQAGGGWVSHASSWPLQGLPAAGIPVPAVDQTSGTVLGPQGTVVPGVRPGGINTGAQDSICRGNELPQTTAARGSTDALGSLPAPYEVEEPLGKFSGKRAHGVMLILHGGSWRDHGRGALEQMRGDADRWRTRGWRTVNADYRPCGKSIDDVLVLFDRVRQVYGGDRPICVSGASSGAHLALLLAAYRPEVACVASQAGPADLTTIATQAATRRDGSPSNLLPLWVSNVSVSVFGADRQARVSPARLGLKARVLFAIAASDASIPWAQATSFADSQRKRDASAYVDTMRLENGDVRWIHAEVAPAALARFHAHEKLLTDPLVRGGLVVDRSIRLSALRRRGLRASYTCPGACKVSAKLTLDARTARKLGMPRTIAAGGASRPTFGTSGLVVKLGAKARKKMKRAKVRLVVTMRSNSMTRRFTATVSVR